MTFSHLIRMFFMVGRRDSQDRGRRLGLRSAHDRDSRSAPPRAGRADPGSVGGASWCGTELSAEDRVRNCQAVARSARERSGGPGRAVPSPDAPDEAPQPRFSTPRATQEIPLSQLTQTKWLAIPALSGRSVVFQDFLSHLRFRKRRWAGAEVSGTIGRCPARPYL